MKICQVREYTPPASGPQGAERVVESICRGLQKLGHEVVLLSEQPTEDFDIPVVSEVPPDCDLIHFHGWYPDTSPIQYNAFGIPWVCTIHGGGMEQDPHWIQTVKEHKDHMIFVSKFIADRLDGEAFVWTSSQQEHFKYSEQKENYFLWMAGTDWGNGKGLFTTIRLAKKLRFNLKIAGTGKNEEIINIIKQNCDDKIEYVGEVNGEQKADLLSKAKGFFLLTQLPDACPTVVGECMLSGTPIIGSAFGSVPELVTPDVGFICETDTDIAKAVAKIKTIKPSDCLQRGLQYFESVKASEKLLQYYTKMLDSKMVF